MHRESRMPLLLRMGQCRHCAWRANAPGEEHLCAGMTGDAPACFLCRLAFGKRWKCVTDAHLIRWAANMPDSALSYHAPPQAHACCAASWANSSTSLTLPPAFTRETALEMEAASGLPALEAGLLGFCASRAAVLHLLSTADSLEALLAQVGTTWGACYSKRGHFTPSPSYCCVWPERRDRLGAPSLGQPCRRWRLPPGTSCAPFRPTGAQPVQRLGGLAAPGRDGAGRSGEAGGKVTWPSRHSHLPSLAAWPIDMLLPFLALSSHAPHPWHTSPLSVGGVSVGPPGRHAGRLWLGAAGGFAN